MSVRASKRMPCQCLMGPVLMRSVGRGGAAASVAPTPLLGTTSAAGGRALAAGRGGAGLLFSTRAAPVRRLSKLSPRELAFREEQERLRAAQEAAGGGRAWWQKYNKTYTGAEAEGLYQAAGALTLGLLFIGLPLTYTFMTTVIKSHNAELSALNRAQGEDIQRRVLERKLKRLNEIRRDQGLEEVPTGSESVGAEKANDAAN